MTTNKRFWRIWKWRSMDLHSIQPFYFPYSENLQCLPTSDFKTSLLKKIYTTVKPRLYESELFEILDYTNFRPVPVKSPPIH